MALQIAQFLRHLPVLPVTLDSMATVVSVQADTEQECVAELAWQVEHRGAVPVLPPMLPTGSRRWIARVAIPEPQSAPAQQ